MACHCTGPERGSGPCPGTDRFFSRDARRLARRYRRRGPERIQRKMIEGLLTAGIDGASLLEIGCGTGDLHRRLLAAGAHAAVGIDVAHGMLAEARAEARRAGMEDRVSLIAGDAVALATDLEEADVVLLDKVLCCYPEIDALQAVSLARAKRLYATVIPRHHRIVAAIWKFGIGLLRLFGSSFHPYYHDWPRAAAVIEAAGFERVFSAHSLSWETWIFRRRSQPDATAV